MLSHLMIAALAVVSPAQQTDTTFALDRGQRVRIVNRQGDIRVESWNRPEVRVVMDADGRRTRLVTSREGRSVSIAAETRGNPDVGLEIWIPESIDVEVRGTIVDVVMERVSGEVFVQTTQGDVSVIGGVGTIQIETTNGDAGVSRANGRISLKSFNGDVSVRDSEGSIEAETLNGEITMAGVRTSSVEASTVNGEIWYEGNLAARGSYRFSTHNGDIDLIIPSNTGAQFVLSTARGEFESDCPVRVEGPIGRSRELGFTIGDGAARVEVGSFGGTVKLRTTDGCW